MPLEGKRLGRYRILHIIGSGGMGEVYLGEDTSVRRQVAIKVIKISTAQDNDQTVATALRLFLREATAIAALDNPNILPLYDHGEETLDTVHFAYLVTPYRAEGSLANWLHRQAQGQKTRQLTLKQVACIVQQAGKALQYAHNHKIIHRDVKPANFLVREDPETGACPDLLLADFGIALLSSATTNISQNVHSSSIHMMQGQGAGTPTYMAPEQWTGEPTFASDQYALAVMTYELLTGQPPFQGAIWRVMHAHLNEIPQPPSAFNPQLPKDIDTILLRALAKKPEERFPSISAFAKAFRDAAEKATSYTSGLSSSILQNLDTKPLLNTQQTGDMYATLAISIEEARRGTSRFVTIAGGRVINVQIPPGTQHGQVLTLVGQSETLGSGSVGNLYLTCSVVDAQLYAPPKSDEPPTAALTLPPTGFVTPHEKQGTSRRKLLVGLTGLVAVAASATYLVASGEFLHIFSHPTPNPKLGRTPTATATPTQTPTPSPSPSPSTSPSPTPTPPSGALGANLVTYRGHSRGVSKLAQSPDGWRIASGSQDTTVQVWDATNGNPFFTYHGHSDVVYALAWSPDGRHIASGGGELNVNQGIHDHVIRVWDATTQQLLFTYRND